MKIGILSRKATLYPTSRLVSAAGVYQEKGLECDVIIPGLEGLEESIGVDVAANIIERLEKRFAEQQKRHAEGKQSKAEG